MFREKFQIVERFGALDRQVQFFSNYSLSNYFCLYRTIQKSQNYIHCKFLYLFPDFENVGIFFFEVIYYIGLRYESTSLGVPEYWFQDVDIFC